MVILALAVGISYIPVAKAGENASLGLTVNFEQSNFMKHRACQLGKLRTDTTPRGISLEWSVKGDSDTDATCQVQYRKQGEAAWHEAMPLFRVYYRWHYNNREASTTANLFAGSILFLEPATAYEIKLTATDPDGITGGVRVFAITTRAEPKRPAGGRVLHVVPGSGRGSGTRKDPIQGIARAALIARPGDTMLLHSGNYGLAVLRKHGTKDNYVLWRPAKRARPILSYINIQASFQWFDGLEFTRGTWRNAMATSGNVTGVVFRKCKFNGYRYTICLRPESRGWYIMDNVIVGDGTGEGIELNRSSSHTIAHNSISKVSDGISYPGRNCDIYGNDIFDVNDDAIECDDGYANIRIWNNRLLRYRHHGISFQPMRCGPWYIIRNILEGRGYAFKFRVQDRFVLANNTIVREGPASKWMQHILTGLSRNNLFINTGDGPVWQATLRQDTRYHRLSTGLPGWMTDVDYDGFQWQSNTPFVWDRKPYQDVRSFAASVGIEKHGRRIQTDSDVIDAGVYLPNITEGFYGRSPDIGAIEHGAQPLHFGPRGGKEDLTLR